MHANSRSSAPKIAPKCTTALAQRGESVTGDWNDPDGIEAADGGDLRWRTVDERKNSQKRAEQKGKRVGELPQLTRKLWMASTQAKEARSGGSAVVGGDRAAAQRGMCVRREGGRKGGACRR
jgi:hypothetical protein